MVLFQKFHVPLKTGVSGESSGDPGDETGSSSGLYHTDTDAIRFYCTSR